MRHLSRGCSIPAAFTSLIPLSPHALPEIDLPHPPLSGRGAEARPGGAPRPGAGSEKLVLICSFADCPRTARPWTHTPCVSRGSPNELLQKPKHQLEAGVDFHVPDCLVRSLLLAVTGVVFISRTGVNEGPRGLFSVLNYAALTDRSNRRFTEHRSGVGPDLRAFRDHVTNTVCAGDDFILGLQVGKLGSVNGGFFRVPTMCELLFQALWVQW